MKLRRRMTCGARVTARDVLRMSMRQNLSISYVIQKANGVKVIIGYL